MPHAARPSEIHRLEPAGAQPLPPAPPRRSWGLLATVAVLLVTVAAYAYWTATGAPTAVDVDAEDDAVAALGLYLEQIRALEAVQSTAPGGRPAVAARHAARIETALQQSRTRLWADAAARAYWGSPRHEDFVEALRSLGPDGTSPEPPALVYLHAYVRRLPPELLSALQGHPVGGPALARLHTDAP